MNEYLDRLQSLSLEQRTEYHEHLQQGRYGEADKMLYPERYQPVSFFPPGLNAKEKAYFMIAQVSSLAVWPSLIYTIAKKSEAGAAVFIGSCLLTFGCGFLMSASKQESIEDRLS
jgi:hypothetical protein